MQIRLVGLIRLLQDRRREVGLALTLSSFNGGQQNSSGDSQTAVEAFVAVHAEIQV
jgi:hypothetical protein